MIHFLLSYLESDAVVNPVGMRGDGFIELKTLSGIKLFTLRFATEEPNALLMVQGTEAHNMWNVSSRQRNNQKSLGHVFKNLLHLCISVTEGKVRFENLQNGRHYIINCSLPINDGQLHTLHLVRRPRLLSLQLGIHFEKEENLQKIFRLISTLR